MPAFSVLVSKAWAFLRHYWYIPIGLGVAIIIVLMTRDKKALVDWSKTLRDAGDSHRAELKAIDDAHDQQRIADNLAITRSVEVQRQLMEHYAQNERTLDETTQKRVKQITKELRDDPQAMAVAIEKETGFRVIIL